MIARLGGRYLTEYTTDVANDPLFIQDDTLVLDASVSLESDRWSVQLWSKNVADEDLIRGGTGMPAAPTSIGYWVGDPRTYGLTGRVRF